MLEAEKAINHQTNTVFHVPLHIPQRLNRETSPYEVSLSKPLGEHVVCLKFRQLEV